MDILNTMNSKVGTICFCKKCGKIQTMSPDGICFECRIKTEHCFDSKET